MSYSITIKSGEDGVKIDSVSGDVPAGKLGIAGHQTDAANSFTLTQYGSGGELIAQMSIYGQFPRTPAG